MKYIAINANNKTNTLDLCVFFIWLCMVLTPFIDNLVGYFMNTSGEEASLSKLFRIFFLLLLFTAMLLTFSRKKAAMLLLFLSYILLLPFLYSLLNHSDGSIATDITYLFKLLFPLMYIAALKELDERGYPVFKISLGLLRYFSVIYPVSVIVSVLAGGGYKSYGSIGIRGFFSSGNESSIVLGVMFIVNYAFMRKKITVFSVGMTLLSAITGILTASKAILLLYVLFGLFIVFKKQNARIRNMALILAVFVFLFFVMKNFFYEQILIFMERMQFRYRQLGNSFWNVLFSNRNQKILPNFAKNYLDPNGIFYFIFGRGSYYHIYATKYNQYIAASGLIEMDFFDVLLQNGMLVFVVTIIFYGRILRKKGKGELFSFFKFSCFVMLLFAFMAGHVLYNPLSSTVLALLCSLVAVYKEPDLEKETVRNGD